VDEFEPTDLDLHGKMTITIRLVDADAPVSTPSMKGYRPASRLLITSLAGGLLSRNSQHSSRRNDGVVSLRQWIFGCGVRTRPPRRRLALKEGNHRPDLARTLASGQQLKPQVMLGANAKVTPKPVPHLRCAPQKSTFIALSSQAGISIQTTAGMPPQLGSWRQACNNPMRPWTPPAS
jgi:hypothetical protein